MRIDESERLGSIAAMRRHLKPICAAGGGASGEAAASEEAGASGERLVPPALRGAPRVPEVRCGAVRCGAGRCGAMLGAADLRHALQNDGVLCMGPHRATLVVATVAAAAVAATLCIAPLFRRGTPRRSPWAFPLSSRGEHARRVREHIVVAILLVPLVPGHGVEALAPAVEAVPGEGEGGRG